MRSTPGTDDPALFTNEQTGRIDRLSLEGGIPETQLMGQAALATYYRLESLGLLCNNAPEMVHILVGKGNNGGDGLALVSHILGANSSAIQRIRIYRAGNMRTETSRFYEQRLMDGGIEFLSLESLNDHTFQPGDVIIDGLLGSGQKGHPRGEMARVLRAISEARAKTDRILLIALDLPTGLSEDTPTRFCFPGQKPDEDRWIPAPDEIHAYGVDRLAVRLNPDLSAVSRMLVLPMGFDHRAIHREQKENPATRLISQTGCHISQSETEDRTLSLRFSRKHADHKYRSGFGALIGGSPGMEGAILLASRTFFSSGGGILKAFVPEESSREFLTASFPSVMVRSIERNQDRRASREEPENPVGHFFHETDSLPSAIGIGCGLDQTSIERIRPLVFEFLRSIEKKRKSPEYPLLILDAGACQWALHPDFPHSFRAKTLLTPHTGEWKSMGGRPIQTVEDLAWNRSFVQESGIQVLVKDAVSVLFTMANAQASEKSESLLSDPVEVRVFSRPDGRLAVAGSGDALVGILVAAFSRAPSEPVCLVVKNALNLYHRAMEYSLPNPSSSDFPSLIQAVLSES